MSTSRRSFLKKGTVIALAAGVPVSFAKDVIAESLVSAPTPTHLKKKDFEACLNTQFVVMNAGNRVKTRLVEVSDLPRPKQNISVDKEGFSLLFRSERTHSLNQNSYVIEHEKLGRFSFLLVPAKEKDQSGNYYVATINRPFP